MENVKVNPKAVFVGLAVMAVADQLLLLLGAMIVYKGVLAYESAELWSIMCLVMSAFIGSVVSVRAFSLRLHSYLSALVYFMIMFLSSIATENIMSIPTAAKELTALFCGVLSGNFFGDFRHNRLRNSSKKKRHHTK